MGILSSVIFGLSVLISLALLFYVLIAHNWKSFLALGIAALPISLYFLSGEPPIQYAGLFSLICFTAAIFLRVKEKKRKAC